MKLRRLEIRDFRKIGHVEIGDLADGLNVVVGDNEAGKSTLLAALRAVLFERHRVGGDVADAMLPYGQKVRPEVWLDFERNGVAYQLHKAFCQKPMAELSGGGERFSGDAVEDKLAEMFGFSPPARGGSKPGEHHGIFGLLWVEQATAHHALDAFGSRASLSAALEREVGQVTGGDRGRLLLAAAEARRDEYWDRRGNPKGEAKTLATELAGKKQSQQDLQQQIAGLDGKIARLGSLQEILARHRRDGSVAGAEAQLAAARTAAERVARQVEQVNAAAAARDNAALRLEQSEARLATRRTLAAKVDAAIALKERQNLELAEAQAGQARLDAAQDAAAAAQAGLASERDAAERAVAEGQRAAQMRQAADSLAQLGRQLDAAEAAERARRAAQAAVAAIPLKAEDIERLETLDRAAAQAKLQRDSAGVQLLLHPEPGRQAFHDASGAPIAGDGLIVTQDTVLRLDGFGRVELRVAGDVGERSRAAAKAEATLAAGLAKLGEPDLATARRRFAALNELRAELRVQTQSLAALAPQGIEALRSEADRLRAVAGDGSTDTETLDTVTAALEAARQKAAALRTQADLQATEAALAARTAGEGRTQLAVLRHAAGQAEAALMQDRDALAAARDAVPDAALEAAVAADRGALAAAGGSHAAAKAESEAADPEATRLMLVRAEAALKSIRADIDAAERERRDLDVELGALGKDGLGEQLETLSGEIALGEARLERVQREAEAAKLLFDTLAEAERETKEAWLAPVRARSAPYLRLIEPDSAIRLRDDSFEIDQIVRNGVAEPFSGLSVGAREQVAVITRLALADILRDSGQESCVVLDDALVNTDEARLERMHLVLHRAAEHQQILILTCRERDFLNLGAPIRRM